MVILLKMLIRLASTVLGDRVASAFASFHALLVEADVAAPESAIKV